MAALVYIHGFLSSPRSHKALQVHDWLAQNRPDIDYYCPFLTPYFGEARAALDTLVTSLMPGTVMLMGSSLGGFWATYLAEKYDLRAVLINPAAKPGVLGQDYVGVELKNYHTDDTYVLTKRHIQELLSADTPVIRRHDNYWLMVQTGDETLDYRLALEKYAGCKQLIERGGSHAFDGFERLISRAIAFLEEK